MDTNSDILKGQMLTNSMCIHWGEMVFAFEKF